MLTAKDIASFLSKELIGNSEIRITKFSKLDSIESNSLVFVKQLSERNLRYIENRIDILAIVPKEYANLLRCSHIISENPRYDFIQVLSKFFVKKIEGGYIHHTAIIEPNAKISNTAIIGPYCFISSTSSIGDNTILTSHVVVTNGSTIGSNCEIKSGVVIGQSGFGFERDTNGYPIKFPHFGSVKIGNNVYIGANTTIDQGTLGDTIIEDDVKIDNLVHIAHNCHIKNGAFIIAGAILGGGTKIGQKCWVAPNVTVKEQTIINGGALIGLGAVVLKEVPENSVMVGNPAKRLVK